MTFVAVDTTTKEGKALAALVQTLDCATVYNEASSATLKAVKDAREGETKPVDDSEQWLSGLFKK